MTQQESSLLELQAADYFKLDVTQVHMFNRRMSTKTQTISKNLPPVQPTGAMKRTIHNHELGDKSSSSSALNGCLNGRRKSQTPSSSNRLKVKHEKAFANSQQADTKFRAGSSTTSTNSLPSISSSPSVSPSLVCPHLSIDDILSSSSNKDLNSPHTIGLCKKCRLNPPPNIHSPLSPAFKPSSNRMSRSNTNIDLIDKHLRPTGQKMSIKRGYSDHQVSGYKSKLNDLNVRDDSLDYSIEPSQLKRMQMSPILRHSVEFIRNNSIESGRVIRIFKNGQPYDKPLRICITRNEFANLDNLLDHINSRQLVQSGARYLFHMDGQLVYSVHELKHGSAYIVSGTRVFDTRANNIIREQRLRESQLKLHNDNLSTHESQLKSSIRENSNQIGNQKDKSTKLIPIKKTSKLVSSAEILPRQPLKSAPDRRSSNVAKNSATKLTDIRKSVKVSKDHKVIEKASNLIESEPKMNIQNEGRVKPLRAKSELSALPPKRKKNVTFEDQKPSSRSTIGLADQKLVIEVADKVDASKSLIGSENSLNDIGIQVSNSIEGFLVDLPITLPQDVEKETTRRNGKSSLKSNGRSNTSFRPKSKVMTITERQLSLDEMDKFKDLDHGDHHSEKHKPQPITIQLDSTNSEDETSSKQNIDGDQDESPVVPDRTGTINIGADPGPTSALMTAKKLDSSEDFNEDSKWQYPGGRESTNTPVERPVSQSDANDCIHARVTTPTPSLSTVGDTNSLSMSYELSPISDFKRTKDIQAIELPPKEKSIVSGTLRAGFEEPNRNFRLIWVNGFAINDQYPDNSSLITMQNPDANAKSLSNNGARLSPSYVSKGVQNEFKLSDRFSNWMCHSRKHDELLYPAGTLIVLWCRWTNEQRYYSRHTANVSAITLASVNADLASSAQISDPNSHIVASIHLWSLTTLATLLIVNDDSFSNKHIYAMRVKTIAANDCELSVSAKDDRRISLYHFSLNLDAIKDKTASDTGKSERKRMTVIKEHRPLNMNQSPLMIQQLLAEVHITNQNDAEKSPSLKAKENLLLSFGRRHFQVWRLDTKMGRLNLLQAENKSIPFVESITKATNLARLAPMEFLLGDSSGNVTLLLLSYSSYNTRIAALDSVRRKEKYGLDMIDLFGPRLESSRTGEKPTKDSDLNHPAITCLCRVSGSLFAAADSTCTIKFWKIEGRAQNGSQEQHVRCRQVSCISLPRDLGYICTLVLSNYNRKHSIVEFYVVSSSNAILFGSVQLQLDTSVGDNSRQILANSSLSVVYEGHETSVMSLVADQNSKKSTLNESFYFTCSMDCKICKWNGQNLLWKSMLPSACVSLAIHPTGFVLAIGSVDGTVYILDKISGLLISYFPLTPVRVNCLAYSQDGALLAAGCANGSIFILPVYEKGLKYKKVSIFQSPHPVMSIQFSLDNRHILTSVTRDSYQELILWDLPNFRYMKDNVRLAVDKIAWYDSICCASEDVRAIWENTNLIDTSKSLKGPIRQKASAKSMTQLAPGTAINLSCHRLIRDSEPDSYAIASDTRGHLRLFRYPCNDIEQGFYEARVTSSGVNCCRFLSCDSQSTIKFVSSSLDGLICLWQLEE